MAAFESRRDALRQLLRNHSLPALLVTAELNVGYLTGFTGDSSYLLVTDSRELLITDGRYTQQLAEECPDLELAVRQPGKMLPDFAADVVAGLGIGALAVEADHLVVSTYERIKDALKTGQIAHSTGLVEALREIKDDGEINAIRQAIGVAEQAFGRLRSWLQAGQTEKQAADELEHQIRLAGGTCGAFPAIVGVGKRAALPHGRPVETSRIGDDDFVLIDWGARQSRYHSDLTRVLVTGKLSPQLEALYELVLRAQHAAIAAIRPGAIMKDVDAAARQILADAGYGKEFNHSLGHGIGLDIHELPRLAPGQDKPLAAGMVVTVEPGVYLSEWGGIRIEDDVLVTTDGCEVLTSLPTALSDCVLS